MRPTFSLRALLMLTVLIAFCALMIRTSDWIAALGFAVSASLLIGAVLPGFWTSRGGGINLIRGGLILLAAVIGWFCIVDFSYWCEWCDHCTQHRYVHEYRVCGFPVWLRRGPNHVDELARLRSDLGVQCDHEYDRQHLVRAWGLVYPARPCIGITCCVTDPEYYDDQVSQNARQFADENPDAAQRLCEHIINNEDYDEMHNFIATMKEPDAEWDVYRRFDAAEPRRPPELPLGR